MTQEMHLAAQSAKIINALKTGKAKQAEALCRDVLIENPSSPPFLRLLAHSLLRQGKGEAAEQQLRFALTITDDFPPLYEDLGSILAQKGDLEEALPLLERAARLDSSNAEVHKKIGQVLAAMGRGQEADTSFQDYFTRDKGKENIAIGLEHIRSGRLEEAEIAFKKALREAPDNVDAMRLLALSYRDQDKKLSDAEALLRRATDIAPDFLFAWLDLGGLLQSLMRADEAIKCFEAVLIHEADNADALAGLASAYGTANFPDKALDVYRKLISIRPEIAGYQMGFGHVLKTTGHMEESLTAYRRAIELRPDYGEVYWSMANLKIFKFRDTEIKAMEEQLATNEQLDVKSSVHMHFSLGKAYEDQKEFDKAWHHYHEGNLKQRPSVTFDPAQMNVMHKGLMDTFTADFLEEKKAVGDPSPDPIFIVGLPRSGSTLIEQILASHSQVEGTAELSDLGRIASSIGKYRVDKIHYPQSVLDLRDMDFKAYGQEYLEAVKPHRVEGKPFFTDKLPNNFAHIGLLSTILPNAKIIDARRHPLDSCLGAYKQLFAAGQNFTYDIFELGEYYQNYDSLMTYWHSVLPGKIYTAHYEHTVLNLEDQVRGLLDFCGLPFEENCLNFHENKRAVLTASSEQVRQPIYKGGLGKWREYESHLEDWKYSLEDILDRLPTTVKKAGLS
ncbi:sulfotransferase [Temperatibacter marinus]|uniref:Sulfotransferase n=1 Tax=Temperatibacter marinus TaxID=1456591 RepID=A0AA52EJX4_9PROT|nr:sulfotransferase [Temperatibacter marinus]WND03882.1 sulfotransferase [Temperatibacter marinus]